MNEKQINNDFYLRFEKQIKDITASEAYKNGKKPSLLLHACCCPCSSYCLEVLTKYFDVTVYFYNPNIDDKEEYDKRFVELSSFPGKAAFAREVKVVNGPYEPEKFFAMAEGMEDLPERGERCFHCYHQRMEQSAKYALEEGYDFFTTTLSISPYKNSMWINEIGMELESKLPEGSKLKFLYSDFKKKNGYKRSIQLSEEYGLYRQDYCGCKFSKRDHERKLAERDKCDC